jgi:hypothetical protein
VTTTKNQWRAASVPIIDQVRVPLELWRKKCEDTSDGGWLIPDIHNLLGRVIKPHVRGEGECVRCEKVPKASGVTWAGLYAGRRGAVTMVMEATGKRCGCSKIGTPQDGRHHLACVQQRYFRERLSGWDGTVSEITQEVKTKEQQ